MSEFNLVYWCKTTGKKLLAKKQITGSYKTCDPETGKIDFISAAVLRKTHKADKNNQGVSLRKISKGNRSPRTFTKEFREYLEGGA